MPGPRVYAGLVLLFLGFGVVLGLAASSPAGRGSAQARRLTLLMPATASATAKATPAEEPPPVTPEATPEAAAESTPETPSPASSASEGSRARSSAPSGGASGGSSNPTGSGRAGSTLPPVKHVFLIALSDQPYASVFGPASGARYLVRTLEPRGALLVRYYAVAHEQLASEVALLSGQGPTVETAANCPRYADLSSVSVGADGQLSGQGCVYPSSTRTLMSELAAKHLSWRAYVEGLDEGAASAGACAHPSLGSLDSTSLAPTPQGPYATFRNPFVYFHSVIDSRSCAREDVGLAGLGRDLAKAKRTPAFAYIAPDRCHDGSPTACTSGAPAGLAPADGFLRRVVPLILRSKAYEQSGLLVITVDEAPSSGELADSSSCCGQPRFPNLPATSAGPAALPARGGGQVGALLLSPFIKAGTKSQEPYNHFSLLRSIEDLFSLEHLGYAAAAGVSSFEPSIFSAYNPG
jgi:phosphatidylinositol-3-phosphatase